MGPRSAQKKRKDEEGADSRWEQVIGNMDKLVGVRIEQIKTRERAKGLRENEGELTQQEAALLPKAAEYATALRDALESGNTRKLDKVA
ncbi:hypothetical protein JW721_03415 [Candidatus Micrarchaeota archaeon]|nr:hypothetical protein [Candidatus Micrarchaeota archaeon]